MSDTKVTVLDLKRLRGLEEAGTCGAVRADELRMGGWSPESSAYIATLVNSASQLLDIAEKAEGLLEYIDRYTGADTLVSDLHLARESLRIALRGPA